LRLDPAPGVVVTKSRRSQEKLPCGIHQRALMKSKRGLIWIVGAFLLPILVLWGLYAAQDPETRELNSATRAGVPGAFAPLPDGYTHYEIGGPETSSKPVVVLAAGFSVPYYIWDPTFKALTSAGFRVLRYDYYGRGYSDRPTIPFTDDMYVRQLDGLLKYVHITGPIDLVGISFGGSFITSFADAYPDRVHSLVYFDPSIRRPYQLSMKERMPRLWSYLTVVFDERFWPRDQLSDFLHPEHFPDWTRRYREQMAFKGFRRSRLLEITSNADADQTEQLERVGQNPRPVLVIWGKEDRTVPFEESEYLLQALPQARLITVEGSGHLPQWEQPDQVHPQLISFLQQ
jgi:pimeloyl-ACP methyl ester carboxylesterase